MAPTPISLIGRARGVSLTSAVKRVFGGWIFAIGASGVLAIRTLREFLLFPIDLVMRIGNQVVEAAILKPLVVVITGSETSAEAVTRFDLFGLPIGVAILLLSFALVAVYLSEERTSDFLPGTFTDYLGGLIGIDEEDDNPD